MYAFDSYDNDQYFINVLTSAVIKQLYSVGEFNRGGDSSAEQFRDVDGQKVVNDDGTRG